MNYSQALRYIHSVSWLGSRPGLSRTKELLGKLGNPEDKLKFIHIAGTNGKGSVASMLSYILTQAGYKTGLYTSPFINRFNERIKINNIDISDDELAYFTEKIHPLAQSMTDPPTEFEIITCLALDYFLYNGCDIAILETGLGGELDSTNAIPVPELSVITSISFDHTAILGDTIEQIASAKAGIIKEGGDVVISANDERANDVLFQHAKAKNASITIPLYDTVVEKSYTIDGHVFCYGEYDDISLPLIGKYQVNNAAIALCAVDVLKNKGWNIPTEAVYSGLNKVTWTARFEILSKNPLFIVDGGHNPDGIFATADSLKTLFPGQQFIFILGFMADKEYEKMLSYILPLAKIVFAVTPDNPRALKAEVLAKIISKKGIEAIACDTIDLAVNSSLAAGDYPVVAAGSLYMSGEIRNCFYKREYKNGI